MFLPSCLQANVLWGSPEKTEVDIFKGRVAERACRAQLKIMTNTYSAIPLVQELSQSPAGRYNYLPFPHEGTLIGERVK